MIGIKALYGGTGVVHDGIDIPEVYSEIAKNEQHLTASTNELRVGAGEHPKVVPPDDIVIADEDVLVPLDDVVSSLDNIVGTEGADYAVQVADDSLHDGVEDVSLGVEHALPIILPFEETAS